MDLFTTKYLPKNLRIKFMFEGQDIPVSGIHVSMRVGAPAQVNMVVPPTDAVLSLQPRSHITVYYGYEPIKSKQDWKVLFNGEFLSSETLIGRSARQVTLMGADGYHLISTTYVYQRSLSVGDENYLQDFSIIEGGADLDTLNKLSQQGISGQIEVPNKLETTGVSYKASTDLTSMAAYKPDPNNPQDLPPPPVSIRWSDSSGRPASTQNITSYTVGSAYTTWKRILESKLYDNPTGTPSIPTVLTPTMLADDRQALIDREDFNKYYDQVYPPLTLMIEQAEKSITSEVVGYWRYDRVVAFGNEENLTFGTPRFSSKIIPKDTLVSTLPDFARRWQLKDATAQRVFRVSNQRANLTQGMTDQEVDTQAILWGMAIYGFVYSKDDQDPQVDVAEAFENLDVQEIYLDGRKVSKVGSYFVHVYYLEWPDWRKVVKDVFKDYIDQITTAAPTGTGGLTTNTFDSQTPGEIGNTVTTLLTNAFNYSDAHEKNMAEVLEYFLHGLILGDYINQYKQAELFRMRILNNISGVYPDPYAASLFKTKYVMALLESEHITAVLGGITPISSILSYVLDQIYYKFIPNPSCGVVGNTLQSLLFIPALYFSDPPACNKLAYADYIDFTYDRQMLTEITRLGASIEPCMIKTGTSVQPFNTRLLPNIISPTKIFGSPTKVDELRKIQDFEQITGIVPDWKRMVDLDAQIIAASSVAQSGPTQAILDMDKKAGRPPYYEYSKAAADKYGVPVALLIAQQEAESSFDPSKVNPKSGATGIAQFMPGTVKQYGLTNPKDPVTSIDAQARYMKFLLNKFGGRVNIALAGYNWGENRKTIENPATWPAETTAYVNKIIGWMNGKYQEYK